MVAKETPFSLPCATGAKPDRSDIREADDLAGEYAGLGTKEAKFNLGHISKKSLLLSKDFLFLTSTPNFSVLFFFFCSILNVASVPFNGTSLLFQRFFEKMLRNPFESFNIASHSCSKTVG